MNKGGVSTGLKKIDPGMVPAGVREVLEVLERGGFSAYLVGGVVRDIVMGREPKDYDVATSATPARVLELFPKVVPTGEKHGTVTVLSGGLGVEVTTLRREGRYSDHRRPDRVEFTGSLKEDLSRRDFTINSLAAGPDGTLHDFFGGLRDIDERIIRAVGDPKKRFREDALRMIRAIRIACQTGFSIEERTLECIGVNRRLIKNVSAERIREELNAILLSGLPHLGVGLIRGCGMMEYILPELADWAGVAREAGKGDLIGHVMDVLKHTPARLNVRLAALAHDLGRPAEAAGQAGELLDRLKYDRRTARSALALVAGRGVALARERKEIKRVISRLGVENFYDLLDLLQAEAEAESGARAGDGVKRLKEAAEEILGNGEPVQMKDLAVNGNDLKGLGIRPGREMGEILNGLLEAVLEDPALNEKKMLLDMARRWKR